MSENETDPQAVRFTADVVAVREDGAVLLIRRLWPPFKGRFALPGGHVDPGETSLQAAVRELQEETGVEAAAADLIPVGTYDADGRDPRGPYSTDAYAVVVPRGTTARAGDDADAVQWVLPADTEATVGDLAFDHDQVLADACRLPRIREVLLLASAARAARERGW